MERFPDRSWFQNSPGRVWEEREDEVLGGNGPKTTQRARDAFAMKVVVVIGCHSQDRSQHRAARVGSPPQDLLCGQTGLAAHLSSFILHDGFLSMGLRLRGGALGRL